MIAGQIGIMAIVYAINSPDGTTATALKGSQTTWLVSFAKITMLTIGRVGPAN